MSDPKKDAPQSTTASAKKDEPSVLRVKNPGPNPRQYYVGRDGLFLPGEVRDVDDPEALAEIRRCLEKGFLHTEPVKLTSGLKAGTSVPANILFVPTEQLKTRDELVKEEEARYADETRAA